MRKINKRKIIQNKLKIMIRDILILFAFFMILGIIFNRNYASNYINKEEIIVQSSNTLWTIASKICSENSKLNIESVMSDIKKINNMNNCDIFEGQVLYVPVYSKI